MLKVCVVFQYVSVQVQRSPVFRRNGVDIHSDILISIAQAILGGTATAQGLYETISIVVSKQQGTPPQVLTQNNNISASRWIN